MTKEELRAHCEKQVKMCEEWAKGNEREPSGMIYEEHKLTLDLINALEQPCEDCVSRQAVLDKAYAYGNGLEPDGYCVNVEDIQALPPVTPTFPKGATNGDIIKALFPNAEVKERNNGYEVYFGIGTAIQFFNYDWWNAPYKGVEND